MPLKESTVVNACWMSCWRMEPRVVRRRGLREDAFQLEYTRHTIYLLRREDIIDVVNTTVNA